MAIKSEPYYWVVCDGCGERADYGDWTAWADENTAVEMAESSDWGWLTAEDGRHLCMDCQKEAENND